jgi:hypothetical protein
VLFTDLDYLIFGKVTNLLFLVCELESLLLVLGDVPILLCFWFCNLEILVSHNNAPKVFVKSPFEARIIVVIWWSLDHSRGLQCLSLLLEFGICWICFGGAVVAYILYWMENLDYILFVCSCGIVSFAMV